MVLFDNSATSPSAISVTEAILLEVLDLGGAVVDSERVLMTGGSGNYASDSVSLREEALPEPGNSVLEVQPGFKVRATYSDADAAAGVALASVNCQPFFLTTVFGIGGTTDTQTFVSGGCDNDQGLDAGEEVSFSVAICNESNRDSFTSVTATLSLDPSSPIVVASGNPKIISIAEPTVSLRPAGR